MTPTNKPPTPQESGAYAEGLRRAAARRLVEHMQAWAGEQWRGDVSAEKADGAREALAAFGRDLDALITEAAK